MEAVRQWITAVGAQTAYIPYFPSDLDISCGASMILL
jgi:hypothetical protein